MHYAAYEIQIKHTVTQPYLKVLISNYSYLHNVQILYIFSYFSKIQTRQTDPDPRLRGQKPTSVI